MSSADEDSSVRVAVRPPEEEDDDSDATYCSAVEECNVIQNTYSEDNNRNIFQIQKTRQSHYPYNDVEEKSQLQPLTQTGIRKKKPIRSQQISLRAVSSRRKPENMLIKHIQQRLTDIREEVNGWLTGWGEELQRSQIEQLAAEIQHLRKAIDACSFPDHKAHVLEEMKQVADKLQYQMNTALNEIVNDSENTCCDCDASCRSCNECACNATTEPSTHKVNISSRDPRLHSVTYCSLMSNKVQTSNNNTPAENTPWNSTSLIRAETNIPSQTVHRPSIKQSASLDALPYSADMFEIDSLCNERNNEQENNHLTQDSTKLSCVPCARKSITNVESVPVHTKDSDSTFFTLQNEKVNVNVPILSSDRELQLDSVRSQFQECNLANTKGDVYSNIVIEEINNGNQLSKLNSQNGSKMIDLSDTTRSQSTVFEINMSRASPKQLEFNESNLRATPIAGDLKNNSLGSEFTQFELANNSSPSHSQWDKNGSSKCEKCSATNNSKNPLSVDIFASCACHIQNDTDVHDVLPIDEDKSDPYAAVLPYRKKSQEQHCKGKSIIPTVSLQRLESAALNTVQSSPQLVGSKSLSDIFTNVPSQSVENVAQGTYSIGDSEIIPCSRNKRLQIDSVSQGNQISQQSAKKKSACNTMKTTKSKARRMGGKANNTQQSKSLSLDMFANDLQSYAVCENKSSHVNERTLKCNKMVKNQHKSHPSNVSKEVELKESLAHCIKRIRLPCPSEYSKDSDYMNNFWKGLPYPLPQEIKASVESW